MHKLTIMQINNVKINDFNGQIHDIARLEVISLTKPSVEFFKRGAKAHLDGNLLKTAANRLAEGTKPAHASQKENIRIVVKN